MLVEMAQNSEIQNYCLGQGTCFNTIKTFSLKILGRTHFSDKKGVSTGTVRPLGHRIKPGITHKPVSKTINVVMLSIQRILIFIEEHNWFIFH